MGIRLKGGSGRHAIAPFHMLDMEWNILLLLGNGQVAARVEYLRKLYDVSYFLFHIRITLMSGVLLYRMIEVYVIKWMIEVYVIK